MIKVEVFVCTGNNSGSKGIELARKINEFIAQNDIEVVDIKHSSAMSFNTLNGKAEVSLSAMLIYKLNEGV